jgi:hypothetical protein
VDDVLEPALGDDPAEPSHALVVISAGEREEIACAIRTHDGAAPTVRPFRLRTMRQEPRRGPAFERRDVDSVPWLRVRSLATTNAGALERFVGTARELRDEPVVVLDVRGCGGGSDRFLVRWFRELTAGELPYFEQTDLESEVTLQGALNLWACAATRSTGDAGGRRWLRARVDRARRELEGAMRDRGPFREVRRARIVTRGRAPRAFRGQLVVVADRRCASACETAILHARHLPGAVVVGENTEGTMKVGEIRIYRLPASGVWVSAGTRVHHDPRENGFPEGRGYLPDLWLDGPDLETRVAALARCLAAGGCLDRVGGASAASSRQLPERAARPRGGRLARP